MLAQDRHGRRGPLKKRGPWSALSSVRDVPWLFLFPVGVDGASRGDCPLPPLLLIEEDLFSKSKKISSWKISH